MGLTESTFTPSEYILLNGDQFAPEASGANSLPLLTNEKLVSGPVLAATIFTAALLANIQEKSLEMNMRPRKGLLGPGKSLDLYIKPINQPPNWNGYTLESVVLFISGQLFVGGGQNTVRNVVSTIIAVKRKDPWQKIIEVVEWGLASSNFLMPVEGEAAAAFSTPFICPSHVQALANAQPGAPIRGLMQEFKQAQPELWRVLLAEIEAGFKDRA